MFVLNEKGHLQNSPGTIRVLLNRRTKEFVTFYFSGYQAVLESIYIYIYKLDLTFRALDGSLLD